MNSFSLLRCAMVASLMFVSSARAEETQEEHIKPGVRAATHTEWLAMQQEKEDKEDAAKKEQSEEEAAADESAAKSIGKDASAVYYATYPGIFYSPVTLSYMGDYVTLNDGSGWTISSSDSYKTMNWLTSDLLVITPNHSFLSSYMFKMTNQNTGVSVKCNLTVGPIYNGIYTHWIVGINYFTQDIYLENGSIWNVSGLDSSIFSQWLINDTIILGVNDGYFSTSRPYILINVNTLTHVRANCAY
ncbi:MAG: hypothetical protein ACK5MA_06640 [Parachlamydiaceae bacterium]